MVFYIRHIGTRSIPVRQLSRCIPSCCVDTCVYWLIPCYVVVCVHTCESYVNPCHGCTHIESWPNQDHSHVHATFDIHHLQAFVMRMQHGKYYFLVYLWQDNAVGLNVTCSKRCKVCKAILNHFRIFKLQFLSAETPQITRHTMVLGQDLSSGSRGLSDLIRSEYKLSRSI